MNFDLIQKLIRLANNNPNDNEANLAARKVCKLLTDYTFIQGQNQAKSNNPYDASMNDIFDMFRQRYQEPVWDNIPKKEESPKTWNDVRRSEEAYWSSKYPGQETKGKKKEEPIFYEKTKPETKPKHNLRCNECGQTIESTWPGNPDYFICGTCKWNIYNNDRQT